MLAMVAVGLWAGLNGGRALWAWPVAFVGVMIVGGALGAAELPLPWVEPGILASVVVLGLLVVAAAATAGGRRRASGRASSHCCTATRMAARSIWRCAAATYAAGLRWRRPQFCTPSASPLPMLASGTYGRLAVRGAGALVAAAGVALALTAEAGA